MSNQSITKYQIPFDLDGNQFREDVRIWDGDPVEPFILRDNIPFVDSLEYQSYDKSPTGGVYMVMRRMTGNLIYVFLNDFAAMIPRLVDGVIHGEFAFVKRGQKYGCYLINNNMTNNDTN